MGRGSYYAERNTIMTILWCGGEDIDFAAMGNTYTSTAQCSTAFARAGYGNGTYAITPELAPFTSIWAHFYVADPRTGLHSKIMFRESIASNKAIAIRGSYADLLITSYNGTTHTTLVTATDVLTYDPTAFDVQLISYGAAGTVNVYANGVLIATYTGDLTVCGAASLSCFYFGSASNDEFFSEIIIADEDTRLMRLKTLAPNADGDTNDWTGAYTDVDELEGSDIDKIYTDTDGDDFQCNLTGMPAGSYQVKAVKITARAVDAAGVLGVQLGVKSGGTVNVGSTQEVEGYWTLIERLMSVNPVTGVAWTPTDIESLQINLRAKTV